MHFIFIIVASRAIHSHDPLMHAPCHFCLFFLRWGDRRSGSPLIIQTLRTFTLREDVVRVLFILRATSLHGGVLTPDTTSALLSCMITITIPIAKIDNAYFTTLQERIQQCIVIFSQQPSLC